MHMEVTEKILRKVIQEEIAKGTKDLVTQDGLKAEIAKGTKHLVTQDGFSGEIKQAVKQLASQESLDSLARATANGFASVETRFDLTDARLGKIENTFIVQKQAQFDQDTKRLSLERRVGAIDNRVATLENTEE